MSLHIARLDTICRTPRGHEDAATFVDTIARQSLPRELLERLGPSLDRQPEVVRLRRLNVTVRIELAELQRGGLAAAWATALVRALHQALARPDQDGEMLRRFETRAAYIAAMIASAARGPPDGASWRFPELQAEAGRHPAIAVLNLLLDAGQLLGDVLDELRRDNRLGTTLALLDEVGLERILRLVADIDGGDGALTVLQLVELALALAAARIAPARGEAASRRQAIEVWLRLNRSIPLRGAWYGIRLLLRFLEEPALLAATRSAHPGRRPSAPSLHELPSALAGIMSRFPDWCERLRRQLTVEQSARAMAALEEMRLITPSAAPSGHSIKPLWLGSDCAGLLLLIPIIRQYGWPSLYRQAGTGPRLFQALVAGAAMRLLRAWQPGEPVEPAAGLLAGLLEEPDRVGIAHVLSSTPPAAVDFLPPAAGWPEALDAAADTLAGAMALRIRGFRNAGRASIARHFLQRPGRILVEEKELRVVLEPSPWSVVLHISGADDAVEQVEWLGGRRVVYRLEGL
jgi:hypothetical protein